ncbi:MAG: hypothetical protein WC551_10880 [Patescibacteria group bacterium]
MSLKRRIKDRLKESSTQAGAGVVIVSLATAFPAYAPLILGLASLLGIGAMVTPEARGGAGGPGPVDPK